MTVKTKYHSAFQFCLLTQSKQTSEKAENFMAVKINLASMEAQNSIISQCARTDWNKRFLPKPMTNTG